MENNNHSLSEEEFIRRFTEAYDEVCKNDPFVKEHPGGWFQISAGNSYEGRRRVSLWTQKEGLIAFNKAVMKELKKSIDGD
jgi:hypothetical protein